jgi:hypothetical protein
MASILIIGEDPSNLEPEDNPPGITAETIRAALNGAREALRAKGHDAQILWTTTADRIVGELAGAVRGRRYDLLVIGAGLRVLPVMAAQFEILMNAIRDLAPAARLAFNARPDDTEAAAERQLARRAA